ncbi:MAG TPA: mercury(II) reductase [Ktedonobacteraceae bacterium]
MTSTQERYDLVILGSGSTAFAAAIHAKDLGKTAVMTEERTLGGTCVNRGCLPSKNLIEAAKLVYDAAHPRYPGLTPGHLGVDFPALIAQKDEVIRQYRDQHYDSIVDDTDEEGQPPIQVVPGHVAFVDPHTVLVTAPDGTSRRLAGSQVLIATGSSPLIPDIPGLSETPYLTSDLLTTEEDLELTELPHSLLILGGGYIALELGQMFARFGSQVTIVTRGASILTGYEPEIAETLSEILHEEGLQIVTGAQVRAVGHGGAGVAMVVQRHGSSRTFTAEKFLVATSRRPNTRNIGLERAGVAVDAAGAVRVDQYLRTSVSHIWAAGDVIGRETESQMATPVGAHDGNIAAHNALSGEPPREVDHTVIPRTIFTDPQVAVVGMTDEEALAAGIACECNTIPLSALPRAGAIRDTRGVIKMVLDRPTRRVVGVSMLGVNAGEVIHEAAMALRFGATTGDFIDLIHVYPTMAEALKLVAISFTKDVNRLSCCAS